MSSTSGEGRHYLHKMMMHQYRKIKYQPQRDDHVWGFWSNLAHVYFDLERYALSLPEKPPNDLPKWAYFMMFSVLPNGESISPVHIKNNAGKPAFSEADWTAAKSELTSYMIAERDGRAQGSKPRILYGILNVGRYSRFYELDPTASESRDFVGSGSVAYDGTRPLELMQDEDTIHAILEDMSKLAYHGNEVQE